MRSFFKHLRRAALVSTAAVLAAVGVAAPAHALSTTVVISQVYGGGGGSGFYAFDYVELANLGPVPTSLNGMALQYGSATGNFGSSASNIFALPATTLAPGHYLLVQLSTAGTSGAALPVTPDAVTTNLSMSQASGKVALTNVTSGLGCGATATPCVLPDARIVDSVAYGASNNGEGGTTANNGAAFTNQQGAVRKLNGCQDTDNNANDFTVAAPPVPRNSASPAASCTPAPLVPEASMVVLLPLGGIAVMGAAYMLLRPRKPIAA